MGGKGERVFMNMYRGHMDKPKKGSIKGGNWGWLVCGSWEGGENCT